MRTEHPRLDSGLQNPSRLMVVAFLSGCCEADFKTVRDELSLSDSTLSKTVSALESLGFVAVRKGFVGRRPRTWIALTTDGRQRLTAHLSSLQALAEQARESGANVAG